MRKIVPALSIALALAFAPGAGNVCAQERPTVRAEPGSIGFVGNVTNSTITTTINQENPETLKLLREAIAAKDASEEKRREAEVKVAQLAAKLGFTSQAVTEFFKILGEQNVPEEKIPARLIEIATHFAATRDQLAALEPDDPYAAEMAKQAKDALEKGQLSQADALLGRAKESEAGALREARKLRQRAQDAEDQHALNLAKIEAGQGDIALLQFHYADAAKHFKEATALLPDEHDSERWQYLNAEADALYREGDKFSDKEALLSAIERYRYLVELRPRSAFPRDWAMTQTNLGDALRALGDWGGGTVRLEEAVATYRGALQEFTRDRAPAQWASIQLKLAAAFKPLSQLENAAATAFLGETLRGWAQESGVPSNLVMNQMGLALAARQLVRGPAAPAPAPFGEAVTAFREALKEITRERAPIEWAQIEENLALAYWDRFEQTYERHYLDDALEAIDGAMEEYRKANAAFYIAKAEDLRETILAAKDK